jgi:hypothetical protein
MQVMNGYSMVTGRVGCQIPCQGFAGARFSTWNGVFERRFVVAENITQRTAKVQCSLIVRHASLRIELDQHGAQLDRGVVLHPTTPIRSADPSGVPDLVAQKGCVTTYRSFMTLYSLSYPNRT